MIASPLRPRHRQEPGIAAAGRLAHRGTPYGTSLSFATTTHLWPLPDPPSRKSRSATNRTGIARSIPGRALASSCRVPPVRVPGQDFHLRSQHPYLAHPLRPRPTGSAFATKDALQSLRPAIRFHWKSGSPLVWVLGSPSFICCDVGWNSPVRGGAIANGRGEADPDPRSAGGVSGKHGRDQGLCEGATYTLVNRPVGGMDGFRGFRNVPKRSGNVHALFAAHNPRARKQHRARMLDHRIRVRARVTAVSSPASDRPHSASPRAM